MIMPEVEVIRLVVEVLLALGALVTVGVWFGALEARLRSIENGLTAYRDLVETRLRAVESKQAVHGESISEIRSKLNLSSKP